MPTLGICRWCYNNNNSNTILFLPIVALRKLNNILFLPIVALRKLKLREISREHMTDVLRIFITPESMNESLV
jgi:hypothetical protein